MKRFLAAFCCLMLASAVMPTALAAQGDANLASTEDMEGYDYVNDGCVLGDTLYLTAHRTLYTWKAGEADVTAYAYDAAISQSDAFVNDIVCTDKSLYAIVSQLRGPDICISLQLPQQLEW